MIVKKNSDGTYNIFGGSELYRNLTKEDIMSNSELATQEIILEQINKLELL